MLRVEFLAFTICFVMAQASAQQPQNGMEIGTGGPQATEIFKQAQELDLSTRVDRPDWEDRFQGTLIGKPDLTGQTNEGVFENFFNGDNFIPIPVGSDNAPPPGSFGGSNVWRAKSVCISDENCETLLEGGAHWVSVPLNEEKCMQAQDALSENSNGYRGIWDEKVKVSETGLDYLNACFSRLSQSWVPADFKSWIFKRIGFIRNGKSVCQLTFLSDSVAVTAGHCVIGLSNHASVSGATKGEYDNIWTRTGVVVVYNGLDSRLQPLVTNAEGRFNDTKFHQATRDYALISPLKGAWPVDLSGAPLRWDPAAHFDGSGMIIFLWAKNRTGGRNDSNTQWILHFDGSPSCVIGSQRIHDYHGVHRCQAVRSSSGSPILTLTRDPNGITKGIAFGVHVGAAATVFGYPSSPPANLAITIPIDLIRAKLSQINSQPELNSTPTN